MSAGLVGHEPHGQARIRGRSNASPLHGSLIQRRVPAALIGEAGSAFPRLNVVTALARNASSGIVRPSVAILLAGLLLVPGTSCAPSKPAADGPAREPDARLSGNEPRGTGTLGPPLLFRAQALPFEYVRGESGAAWPVEATGGGIGLLDYDGDGDLDLYFAQGVPLPVGSAKTPPADCLLRNDGKGLFTDVSARSGLESRGYGQGVAVGDFDGDGDPDVYVTRYGGNTLWRNDGGRLDRKSVV